MKKILLILPMLISLNSFSVVTTQVNYKKIKNQLQKRKSGLTSRITHKKLEKAIRHQSHERYTDAIRILVKLLRKVKKRPYEFAQVWQNLGFVYAAKGDHKKAIKALSNSLKLKKLAYSPTMTSIFTIAQLSIALEDYKTAEEKLSLWFKLAEKPKAQAYVVMGIALSQNGKKEEALQYINQAIKLDRNPSERLLQMALALNYEMKKYKNALKVLAILTSTYPGNARYWKQLSSTYLSLRKDIKALATMELAYKLGHIVAEADLLNMVSLYMYQDMPEKGAGFLEREMIANNIKSNSKNLELLSQSWIQARENEKGLIALDSAAKKSKTGDLFMRKGFIQLEDENWNAAIKNLEKGLVKGIVKGKDKAYYALGVAHYNNKDFSKALNSLIKAKKLAINKKVISQWIEQIKKEQVASL
jgi:tetratricopeptide (TPR) repeat protein